MFEDIENALIKLIIVYNIPATDPYYKEVKKPLVEIKNAYTFLSNQITGLETQNRELQEENRQLREVIENGLD